MKSKTLVIMFVLCAFAAVATVSAYQSLVWRDYFDDNAEKWYINDGADSRCEIKDGSYRITGKKGGIWVSFGLRIVRNGDYSLEAKVRGDASDSSEYVGIVWDMKDENHYYQFVISGRGNFAVQRIVNDTCANIVDWTYSSSIVKGGYNVLNVGRSGSSLVFLINGAEVKRIPYESFSGEYIGFSLSGIQTMTIDQVSLMEEKVYEGEPFPLRDILQAWYRTEFPEGSAPWLVSQGRLSGSWDRLAAPKPGYILEHATRESSDYLAQDLSTDLTYDFAVVAKVKLLWGDIDIDYGIALDVDGQDFLKFGISGNGSFIIARFTGGKYAQIVPWTQNDNINLFESSNTLEVMRKDSKLIFGINEHIVYEMAYDHWTSPKAGFYSHGKMKLRPLSIASYQILRKRGLVSGDTSGGFAAWQYDDGSRYVGFWKDGRRNGRGALYKPDGKVLEGLWKDDAYMGAWAEPGPRYYPVQTKLGDLGLVDAKGAEKGFGLKGFIDYGASIPGPIPASDGKGVGFIDASGILKRSSDWSLDSPFSGGLALVKGSAGVGLINAEGALLAAPGVYQIDKRQDFSSGAIIVGKGKNPVLYGLLDPKGRELRAPDLLSIAPFSEGLAAAKARNGLYGFIDLEGNWRILPKFHEAGAFHEGLAYVMPTFLSEGFIDTKGAIAFTLGYTQFLHDPIRFSEGLVDFDDNGKEAGFLDRKGAEAIAHRAAWDSAQPFSEGLARVSGSGNLGFVDLSGNLAVPMEYKDARAFSQGLAAARKDQLWGYIDAAGEWALQPKFLAAYSFTAEGLAQVRLEDGSWTWIDRSGTPLWRDPADQAIILSNDFKDDAKPWTIGETDTIKTALTQGFYYIKTKQASGGISAIPLEFDRKSDYSLAVTLRYNSTSMNESIGLIWDIQDMSNFYALVLSPQGAYSIAQFKDGQARFIVGWTLDASIKKGVTDNRLEVRHSGEKLEFLINGTAVNTMPYESISGQGIGFACFGATSLIVDSLTLRKGLQE